MTTVFLSGSRAITRLDDVVQDRLRSVTDRRDAIVVGDADGADTAFQRYLSARAYRRVTVFCAGASCRNNVGNWAVEHVSVDPRLTGRAFYMQKDAAMAARADSGVVLWDGKSPGSLNNILALLKRRAEALVYFVPDHTFMPVSTPDEARRLFGKCDPVAFEAMSRAVGLRASMREIEEMTFFTEEACHGKRGLP